MLDKADETILKSLVEKHLKYTDSKIAKKIIVANFSSISMDSVTGPMVQIILVLRILVLSLWQLGVKEYPSFD